MSLFSRLPDGLTGGLLIGLSAGTLLLGKGNILGASGIANSILRSPPNPFAKTVAVSSSKDNGGDDWKLHFMAFFFLVSNAYSRIFESGGTTANDSFMTATQTTSFVNFIVSGFLVGFGTTLGSGCTSGHGICGLARRSKRSLCAVLAFMGTGVLAATTLSSSSPLPQGGDNDAALLLLLPTETSRKTGDLLTIGFVVASFRALVVARGGSAASREQQQRIPLKPPPEAPPVVSTPPPTPPSGDASALVASLSAALFSIGLATGGMIENKHVLGFLDAGGLLDGTWDPTLLFVMVGGLLVSLGSYEFVPGYNLLLTGARQFQRPWSEPSSATGAALAGFRNIPTKTVIDWKLLFGAAAFGTGWGVGGLCPGPSMFLAASGYPSVLYLWWPAFSIGSWVATMVSSL